MTSSIPILWVSFLLAIVTSLLPNITFNVYHKQLPLPLFNHTSVIYSNTLYIIGGHINNNTPNADIYTLSLSSNNSEWVIHNLSIPSTVSLDIYHGISCATSCSVQKNVMQYGIWTYLSDLLYIVQPSNDTTTALITYDLEHYTVQSISIYTNPWLPGNKHLTDGCVVGTFEQQFIFILGSMENLLIYVVADDTFIDYRDNIQNRIINPWLMGRGCFLFEYDRYSRGSYLYFIGGTPRETGSGGVRYIEKTKIIDDSYPGNLISSLSVEVASAELAFARSFFKIIQITDIYYAIIGGAVDAENNKFIEIFNANSEEMLTAATGAIQVTNFDLYAFDALMWNDVLFVFGGRDVVHNVQQEMYYIDADVLLFSNEHVLEFDCITQYDVQMTSVFIDDYLLETGGLIMEIDEYLDVDTIEIEIDSTALQEPLTMYINRNIGRSMQTVYWHTGADYAGFEVDMVQMSSLRNINMSYNKTVFWMKWDAEMGESGYAVTVPYWRMGYGDKYDRFKITDYVLESNWFDENAMFMAGELLSMQVSYSLYKFYTDSCSLGIAMNVSTFNVGDVLVFDWNLQEATSLNIPITITSEQIVDFEYTMYVLEDGCLFCPLDDDICTNCSEGIEIKELETYDIDSNIYEIYVVSELTNLFVTNNPIVLTRNVMAVQVLLLMENGLLYPNSEILITVAIKNVSAPSQPKGNINIIFDQDLGFMNNEAFICIDFYSASCSISYDNDTIDDMIDCKYSMIIPETMKFKSIKENNYEISIESNDVNLIGNSLFSFQRQIQTVNVSFSDSLYLGQTIDIFYDITDDNIYQSVSIVHVISNEYKIDSIIYLYYNDDEILCQIETFGSTYFCDFGIEFQANSNHKNDISLLIETDDSYLVNNQITVSIEECPIGSGLSETSYKCNACGLNEVGIKHNSECMSCNSIDGILCLGSTNIIVSSNYWIAINNGEYDHTYLDELNSNQSHILCTFCPSGMCCQHSDGCNFTDTRSTSLCAPNRDPTVALCGSCLPGYSEVFGSTACKQCERNYYEYLLFPMFIALLVTFGFIYFEDPKPAQDTPQEIDFNKYLLNDDISALKVCVFRSLTYFFQALAFITFQKGFFFYLSPIMKLFAFDVFYLFETKDTESGICFIKNMKLMDEELWTLFFPFCIFMSLGLFALINKYILTKNDRFKNNKKLLEKCDFGWKLVMSMFLILIGNIVSKMFRILGCARIGNSVIVHFYGGYLQCFGFLWVFAFIIILCIIGFWCFIWYLLFKKDANKRESRSFYLSVITRPYLQKYWFWEIVIITRRMLFAFLISFQFINVNATRYLLLLSLVIYFGLHIKCYPFKYQRANRIELICIFLLILASINVMMYGDANTNEIFVSFIMSIIVLTPVIIFIVYVIIAVKRNVYAKKEKTYEYEDQIEKMKTRLTASQQQMLIIPQQHNEVQLTTEWNERDTECVSILESGETNRTKNATQNPQQYQD